jgi:peptide chain release factor subunit 1
MRSGYECGRKFDVDYAFDLRAYESTTGVIDISTKEAKFIKLQHRQKIEEYKITSGISGQHNQGGQSASRYDRKREEQINHFFKRVCNKMKSFDVEEWDIQGDKNMVKRFKKRARKYLKNHASRRLGR